MASQLTLFGDHTVNIKELSGSFYLPSKHKPLGREGFHPVCYVVIVYSVPPKNVPLGHYSPVNNVPPQWILSPLEQGWELSSAEIQALVGWKMSSFWVIWSGLTSHTSLRDYGAMPTAFLVRSIYAYCGVEWFTWFVPWTFLPTIRPCSAKTGKEDWKVSFRE